MDLWKEMICALLLESEMEISFPQIQNVETLFSNACYRALAEIKQIIEDRSMDDANCFAAIEKIVRVYECMGSDGDKRHDFG